MTDKKIVLSMIQNVLTNISPEEFPEVCDYLYSLQKNDGLQSGDDSLSPYAIANAILTMDKPVRFPGCLIDLITGLFEMEIEDGNADAMNDLGAQYYDGNRGFEQSFEKAVRYLFLEGIGVEQNLKNAQICFQKAEAFLYDMVLSGDVMYRKSLNAAVRGQEETREKLAEKLPDDSWVSDH